jgi:S-DNA-T family DNA segregation ATPase FtsK/SpoIIIE
VFNRTAPPRGTDPYLAGDLLAGRLLTRVARNHHNLRSPQGRDDAALWTLGRLVLFLFKHPVATASAVIVGALYLRFGPIALVALAAWLAGVAVVLRMVHRPAYDWIDARVRRRWRIWTIYDPLWRETMIFCGLARALDGVERIPHRRRMRSTRWGDRMVVTLVSGCRPIAVEQVAEHLAHSFGARSCQVLPARDKRGQTVPGRVVLVFRRSDPLTSVIAPIAPAGLPRKLAVEPAPGPVELDVATQSEEAGA